MLNLIKSENELPVSSSEYALMVKKIEAELPMIKEATSNFGKSQSQFMDNFLTVSHPTPLRNARQMLAEINRSVEALKEAQYNLSKKQFLIRKLQQQWNEEVNKLNADEIQLEISYEKSKLQSSQLYVEGAVRSIANYIEQYKAVLAAAGYESMSEEAFEKEEEKYHIMKAFDQALCAARSRGGQIDEGNHIYFSQIGVNGQMAQDFLDKYFQQEREALEKGAVLTHKFKSDFLENMAEFFKGCSQVVAAVKGHSSLTQAALKEKV